MFEFEAAKSLDWLIPGKPEADGNKKPSGNMLEPACSFKTKVYVNEVITLWGLTTLPSRFFGKSLDYNVRRLLDKHSHLPLEQHTPLIAYLQEQQLTSGCDGWLDRNHRAKFKIAGWYIGERFLINLHREPDTIPVSLRAAYCRAVNEVARNDLEVFFTGTEWEDIRGNVYLCRLLYLWHDIYLKRWDSAAGIRDLSFLNGYWGQIKMMWKKECLKGEQVTGMLNTVKLQRKRRNV